jgi:hypothetical protein
MLESIQACNELERNFENCFVFGKGRVVDQVGTLALIKVQQNNLHPIVLTTSEASLGQDIIDVGYVIQTELPAHYSVLV